MTQPARHRPTPETLDPVSQRLLPVLRYFLDGLQDQGSTSWQIGFSMSAEIWGEARGLTIAYRVQRFLSALLNSRPVPIRAADPLCLEDTGHITDDECLILALLTHMRDDEPRPARDILASLTGGRVEAAVVRTGLDLCAVLDGTHGARRGKGTPVLAIVD